MVSMRIVIVAVIAILIDIAVALIIMIVSIIDSFSVLVLSSAGSRGLGACLLHSRRLRRSVSWGLLVPRLARACSNSTHPMHRHQHPYTVFASNVIIVRIVFAIAASIVVIIATIVALLVTLVVSAGVARLQSLRSSVVLAAGDQSGHELSRHGKSRHR